MTAPIPQAPNVKELILDVPFQPGVIHAGGTYSFTNKNYLLEGADIARQFGAQAIFTYLEADFRNDYPDGPTRQWPEEDPQSLVELIQTAPYRALLNQPFKTFVFTAFGFAEGDDMLTQGRDPDFQRAEEEEFYQFAKYLLSRYKNSGKIFILKDWEPDHYIWPKLKGGQAESLIGWYTARQRGVARARQDVPDARNVAVYHAIEVNRVLDVPKGKKQILNTVVPVVKPDLVSYSSHEAVYFPEEGVETTRETLKQALTIINEWAPDPLELGPRRIFISEFGLYENWWNSSDEEKIEITQAVLETAEEFGISYAFHWQLFDNECSDGNGEQLESGLRIHDPKRPSNDDCTGLWLVRPDGTYSPILSLLKDYWAKLRE